MRILTSISAFLFSCSAFAGDLCRDLMVCGVYETSAPKEDGMKKIVITKTSENSADVSFIVLAGSETIENTISVQFELDGSFKGNVRGRLGATGICNGKVCTFSLRPMKSEASGDYGVAGVIRFLPNSLEYSKFAIGKPGPFQSTVLLPKK